MPEHTVIVIDDNYDAAIKSEAIDHLFRVTSGKHMLNVVIMTQNNFTQGKFGRDIRNNCNFTALFRNYCDASINKKVCSMLGLSKAFQASSLTQKTESHPYFFYRSIP
jgi:hypothetical protein